MFREDTNHGGGDKSYRFDKIHRSEREKDGREIILTK